MSPLLYRNTLPEEIMNGDYRKGIMLSSESHVTNIRKESIQTLLHN